jgi:hypothetical protein
MSHHVQFDERRPLNHFYWVRGGGSTWTNHDLITDNKYPVVSHEDGLNTFASHSYTTLKVKGLWEQFDPVKDSGSGATINKWHGDDSDSGAFNYWFSTFDGVDLRFKWTVEVYKTTASSGPSVPSIIGRRLQTYIGGCGYLNDGSSADHIDREQFLGCGQTYPGFTQDPDFLLDYLMMPDETSTSSNIGKFYLWQEPPEHPGAIYGNPGGEWSSDYNFETGDQVHMKMWHPKTNFINYHEEGPSGQTGESS